MGYSRAVFLENNRAGGANLMKMLETRPWEEVDRLVDIGDAAGLQTFLMSLPRSEAARALSRLADPRQADVLAMLGHEQAADLLDGFTVAQAADLMEELPAIEAAAILHELPSNEQADLVQKLHREEAEEIFGAMDPKEATEVRRLAAYSPTSAGGLMVTEYLAFHADATVRDVIKDLRHNGDVYADFEVQYLYVVDAEERLVGVLRLRDLVLSSE